MIQFPTSLDWANNPNGVIKINTKNVFILEGVFSFVNTGYAIWVRVKPTLPTVWVLNDHVFNALESILPGKAPVMGSVNCSSYVSFSTALNAACLAGNHLNWFLPDESKRFYPLKTRYVLPDLRMRLMGLNCMGATTFLKHCSCISALKEVS